MEITGKLIQKLPVQTGQRNDGTSWSKAEFVFETIDQYPKKICANLWGDRARALDQFQEGSLITVSFDLESREYNGRWYTDVKAWKVDPATPAAVAGAPMNAPAQGYVPQPGYAPQGYAQPQQPMYPPQGYPQPQQGYVQPQQGFAQPQQGYAQPQQPAYPPQNQGYTPTPPQTNPVVNPGPDMNTLPNIPEGTFTDVGETDDLPF